jgi:hypothetical protein
MTPEELVGKSHTFEDGNKIEVIQCKRTDEDRGGHLLTYLISQGPGLPRKLVMGATEFIGTFGHLFNE